MPTNITVTTPPPIVVQAKGGKSTVIVSPTGSATRLVELSDVDATTLNTGDTLVYSNITGEWNTVSGNSFGAVNVAGQNNVVATVASDTLILRSGTGILLTTDSANGTVDIAATGGSAFDSTARDIANAAFDQANSAALRANTLVTDNVPETTSNLYFTSARVRANVTNTAPINYDPSTGTFSHADSAAAATTYGNTTFVPVITLDAKGHIIAVTNTAIAGTSGTDQFARDQANAAFNQANTANTVAASSYNQANIATTNADAAFTRANTANVTGQAAFNQANSGFTLATTANTVAAAAYNQANIATTNADAAFARANAAYSNANTAIYTAAQIRANISNTAPINYDSSTGTISHATSGVSATGYGDSSHIPVFVVDDKGHITSVSNVAIDTGAGATDAWARDQANGAYNKANSVAQNAFVTINVAGQSNVVADSNVDTLILVAGTGISITTDAPNDTITIASTGGATTDQFARDQANAAFNQANTANTVAASAYAQANIATTNADAAFARANTANVTGQAAFDKANSGFTLATTANTVAAAAYAQANIATTNADAAFARANAAYANANTAIYTAAQIRANLSNTAPINYDAATGIVSHALSGAVATTYGNTTFVPTITVDDKGHVTAIVNTAIALPPSTDEFARAHANAAFDRANTANTVAASAYVQANIATTNADAAFAKANAAYANANTAIYTATQIRANISNTAPINYDAATGIVSHADSGVVATGHGDAATIPKIVVDAKGHVTGVTNTSIAIAASQITSGTLSVARGGTGQTAITVNGSLLIGNTVSGGFDVNPLTQGSGISITNDKGSITIAATGGSAIDQYARDKANGAAQNAFITINVAGQSDIVADSNVDTLTLVAGNGMIITTNAVTDTITISANLLQVGEQVGAIEYHSGRSSHINYLEANGATVSRTTYSELFAEIGDSYGSGDGSTTFTLPDMHPTFPAWVVANNYPDLVERHTVTVLSDNRVLVIGGLNSGVGSTSANVYFGNVSGNNIVWTAASNTLPAVRSHHSTHLLNDGRVLVVGGRDGGGGLTTTTYFGNISGTTIVWTSGTSLNAATSEHGASLLADGRLVVTGGASTLSNTEFGNISGTTITWSAGTALPLDRKNHVQLTTADDRLLLLGGRDGSGTIGNQVYFGDVVGTTVTWRVGTPIVQTRSDHAAIIFMRNKILLVGGVTTSTTINPFVGIIDGGQNITWKPEQQIPTLTGLRTHTDLGVLANNDIILVGGYDGASLSQNVAFIGSPLIPMIRTNAVAQIVMGTTTAEDQFARDRANGAFAQANIATTNADAAFAQANAAYANANTAIYTAAQIRANLSNTAPINYDAATGIVSHALSGVVATTYGNTTFVPTITVDDKGHVTAIVNTAIALPPSTDEFARAQANAAYAQANIATTNADAAFAQANAAYANANTAIYTAAQIRANVSNVHPVSYNQSTGQFGIVAANANGAILISNTVSGGYDISQLTGGLGIVVSTSQGGISLDTAVGKTYYMVLSQASDVPTYNVALTMPSANAEINTSAIFTGTAYSLTASFITPNNEPGTTLLPAGTFGRHFHATTDGAANYAQLRIDLSKRMANGTEVLLRTNESPIFSSANATNLLVWNITDASSYSLVSTDRLLWQVYARRVSGGSGSVAVTIFYEGNTRASYITSTILDGGADVFARIQANNAYNHANGAFAHANAAFLKANGAAQNAFVTITVAGQSDIVADSNVDTLTIAAGSGVTLTTDAGTDTLTISAQGTPNTATSGAVQFNRGGSFAGSANLVWDNGTNSLGVGGAPSEGRIHVQSKRNFGDVDLTYYESTIRTSGPSDEFPRFELVAYQMPWPVGASPEGPEILLKADSGTPAAKANTLPGQSLGAITARGINGAANPDLIDAARIRFTQAGNSSSQGVPGHIQFYTNSGDSAAAPERMRITQNGFVGIGTTTPITNLEIEDNSGTTGYVGLALTHYAGASGVADVEFFGQAAQGTRSAPSALLKNDILFALGGAGHNGAAFTTNRGYLYFDTAENWTAANNGVDFHIDVTPNNSTIPLEKFTLRNNGMTGIGNTVPQHLLTVSGNTFIRDTLTLFSGIQDATGTTGANGAVLRSNGTAVSWTGATANGQTLIGNTVSGGFDIATLTAGSGININNLKGSIEIVATGGSAIDQFARDTANGAFAHANGSFGHANGAFAHANGAFAKANTIRKSITVPSPVVTDNITFFFTDVALTFTKIVSVVRGSATPNVVFLLSYESSRHTGATRTNICENITCANTTNGVFTTTFSNPTVPANNYVTLTFSTVSGTVNEIAITMIG